MPWPARTANAAALYSKRFAGRDARKIYWALVVGVSGVLAHKTGAALEDYNRGPSTVQTMLARWNETTGRADASLAGAVRHLVGEATGEQAAGEREAHPAA